MEELPDIDAAPASDFIYEDDGKGTLRIIGYTGSGVAELRIPNKIEGKRVDSIAFPIRAELKDVTSVVIPYGVTTLATDCFREQAQITAVTLPGSLTVIENSVFLRSGLKSIELPDSVVSIGISAFGSCADLTTARLSDNLTVIPKFAFERCDSMTTFNFPANLAEIGEAAFYSCDRLEPITIPDNVTIGERAFFNVFDRFYNRDFTLTYQGRTYTTSDTQDLSEWLR